MIFVLYFTQFVLYDYMDYMKCTLWIYLAYKSRRFLGNIIIIILITSLLMGQKALEVHTALPI
jgi:hypothetical protein